MEGKLKTGDLVSKVLGNIGSLRNEVVIRAGLGEDTAAFDFGDDLISIAIDPISGTTSEIGSLVVRVNSNDIAASGAEPALILLCLLMPVTATEADVEVIMKAASAECKKLNMEIVGGHTEFTSAVNRAVMVGVCVGRLNKKKALEFKNIKAGDVLILAGAAGMEGTAILAYDYEDHLKSRLPLPLLEAAKDMMKETSVVEIGRICSELGVKKMHDCTEGGVYGAIWELCEGAGLSVTVFEEEIEVREATKALCDIFAISPYRLIASGSMLIASDSESGPLLLKALKDRGYSAAVIGTFKEGGAKRVVRAGGETYELPEPEGDAIYDIRVKSR